MAPRSCLGKRGVKLLRRVENTGIGQRVRIFAVFG